MVFKSIFKAVAICSTDKPRSTKERASSLLIFSVAVLIPSATPASYSHYATLVISVSGYPWTADDFIAIFF